MIAHLAAIGAADSGNVTNDRLVRSLILLAAISVALVIYGRCRK